MKVSWNLIKVSIFEQWLNSVNSESLKYPWNSKSIKTDYLQSQTKSENQRNPRNSGTAERMQEILEFFGVLDFLGFL